MAKTKRVIRKSKPVVKAAKRAATPAKNVPAVIKKTKAVPAVRRQTNALAEQAKKLTIKSEIDYQAASDLAGRIKAFIKARDVANKPMIDAAKLTLTRIREEADSQVEGLDEGLDHISKQMTAFEARRKRAQEEKAAQVLEDRRKQEQRERRAKAADLIEEGKDDEARRLLQAPSEVQEVVFQRLTAPGMSKRSIWTWELTDINKVNSEFLTTKDGDITRIVKALGEGTEIDAEGHLAQLGNGIRVFKKDSRAFKAAAEVAGDDEEDTPPEGEALEVVPVGAND